MIERIVIGGSFGSRGGVWVTAFSDTSTSGDCARSAPTVHRHARRGSENGS